MGDGEGVVVGADLHENLHLAGIVEGNQGIDGGAELAVHALVSDLKVTDVLHTLDADGLTGLDGLVELHRFLDALHDHVGQACDYKKEQDAHNRLNCFVHYVCVL